MARENGRFGGGSAASQKVTVGIEELLTSACRVVPVQDVELFLL